MTISYVPPTSSARSRDHVARLCTELARLDDELARIDAWGRILGRILGRGGRLLVAGNGGSAALAQHLTAELVGRYDGERVPLSAYALHADTSSLTAISNDYGMTEVFARQIVAHGRPNDVFLAISTSGSSPNLLAAAERARAQRVRVWALTGPGPNPLAICADDAVAVGNPVTATVQEVHQVLVHLLCGSVDDAVAELTATGGGLR